MPVRGRHRFLADLGQQVHRRSSLPHVQRRHQARPRIVLDWVDEGWLLAERQVRKDGRVIHRFHHDAIKRFCNQHRALLLQRRWPKERLNFCETFVFAPKHAELIDGRESKRERQALQKQKAREEQEKQIEQATLSQAISKTGRNAVGDRRSTARKAQKYDDCA
jgi:hypothetical protein